MTRAQTPSEDASPDSDLVAALVDGSQAALAALYDRHAAPVFQVALRVTGDRGRAEEVVQETFLALWNRAEQFDPALGTLGAWLRRIAKNRAIDAYRADSRRIGADAFSALTADADDPGATVDWLARGHGLVGAGAQALDPEDAADRHELAIEIAHALDVLTSDERTAIVLAYRDGLSHSEIAAALSWPLGTVKTRSRRALRRLRAVIEAAEASGRANTRPGPDQHPPVPAGCTDCNPDAASAA